MREYAAKYCHWGGGAIAKRLKRKSFALKIAHAMAIRKAFCAQKKRHCQVRPEQRR